MVKLVDTTDLKSVVLWDVPVQVRLRVFILGDNMKELLSSKTMSLVCAVLNTMFAMSAFWQGSFIWGILCMCLGGYCYSNYLED